MAKIIKSRERVERREYYLFVRYKDDPLAGLAFNCNEAGEVDILALAEPGYENYVRMLTQPALFTTPQVEVRSWAYMDPAVLLCDCGHELDLPEFTNTCENCGTDYNSSGQRLAPREQWGEETGESLSEILSIGHHVG